MRLGVGGPESAFLLFQSPGGPVYIQVFHWSWSPLGRAGFNAAEQLCFKVLVAAFEAHVLEVSPVSLRQRDEQVLIVSAKLHLLVVNFGRGETHQLKLEDDVVTRAKTR